MIFRSALEAQTWVEPLGWALLHSMWQVAAVTVLTWLALRHRGIQLRPQTRYVLYCGALALSLALPVLTFAVLVLSFDMRAVVNPLFAMTAAAAHTAGPASVDPFLSKDAVVFLPWLVLAWTIGVAARTVWTTRAWFAATHLTRSASQPVEVVWVRKLQELQRRLHIHRDVRLRLSTLIDVPCVIGWLRPVILLPPAACLGLSPNQLEAVLAHELAHIRRHDFLVNTLQRIIEALLFYHPGAWWISRQIRIEREHCCDDVAVGVCADVLTYARALASLESSRHAPQPLTAATGGDLAGRVRRLLSGNENPVPGLAPITTVTLLVAAICAGAVAAPSSAASARQDLAGTVEQRPAAPTEELIRLVDSSPTARRKVDAISRLSGDLSTAAWHKLVLIAERDADFGVRKEAVSYIAGRATPAAVQELIRLYRGSRDHAFKLHVLSYLSGLHTSESMAHIRAVANGESDPVIREKAWDYVLGR
jgi:beta-lactamase regulating signal transducer with metallopeptidase domain